LGIRFALFNSGGDARRIEDTNGEFSFDPVDVWAENPFFKIVINCCEAASHLRLKRSLDGNTEDQLMAFSGRKQNEGCRLLGVFESALLLFRKAVIKPKGRLALLSSGTAAAAGVSALAVRRRLVHRKKIAKAVQKAVVARAVPLPKK
jgi:hypothetical protein